CSRFRSSCSRLRFLLTRSRKCCKRWFPHPQRKPDRSASRLGDQGPLATARPHSHERQENGKEQARTAVVAVRAIEPNLQQPIFGGKTNDTHTARNAPAGGGLNRSRGSDTRSFA